MPANRDQIRAALDCLIQLVQDEFQIPARALLRNDDRLDYFTWMEVYACRDADQAEQLIQRLPALVAHAGLATIVWGERHFERFGPIK